MVLTFTGILVGLFILYSTLLVSQPLLETYFGLFIPINPPSLKDFILLGVIIMTGIMLEVSSVIKVYHQLLVDGMTIEL